MAHPRKKRKTQNPTIEPNQRSSGVTKTNPASRIPKSMVIRMGGSDVGSSVSQLVRDMRQVMEPHTASRLKERRGNKLRDFTTMAGPLGVTHFLLFYRASSGNVNLKLAVTPRGPTFNFHVEKYSLAKDVHKALKRPKTGSAGLDHLMPPLLVMNNFNTPSAPQADTNQSNASPPIPKHLENLTTSIFQSLFPPISPQRTPLSSIHRVLLVNRETASPQTLQQPQPYTLNLRHYAISSKPVIPLSRGLRRLQSVSRYGGASRSISKPSVDVLAGAQAKSQRSKAARGALPDMSRLDDVADYLLEPGATGGYMTASDSEADGTDAEVEVVEEHTKRVMSRRDREKRREALKVQKEEQERARIAADVDGEEHGRNAGEGTRTNGEAPRPRRTPRTQKRAVKLTEIGPRMRLRLYKVEEGLCAGKTLWHEVVVKSASEQRNMEKVWEARRREKEDRKRVQKENVERKREAKKTSGRSGKKAEGKEEEEEDDEDDDEIPEDPAWSDLEADMDVDGEDGVEQDTEMAD